MRLWEVLRWRVHLWFRGLLVRRGVPPGIWYVGTAEVLPPPLSGEEESYLLARLEKGDLAVRGVLIERNLRLVVYIARKFDNTGIPMEDLVSIGTIGLIKAVNTFDPTKRIKLATYASKCIENEILMYLRRNGRTRLEVSLHEPLNIDWDGNELLLCDVLPDTGGEAVSKRMEDEVDRILLHRALARLTPRERRILQLRFGLKDGKPRTQKQVADLLGISQSYISRLEKRILRRLQGELTSVMQ
ncbi:MAG: RNA polymerase sporulation sigma factor SigE [Bacillota bacterium]|nr:RNA polymerase sporulation sigma factor SigE [Bacillota bacterium]